MRPPLTYGRRADMGQPRRVRHIIGPAPIGTPFDAALCGTICPEITTDTDGDECARCTALYGRHARWIEWAATHPRPR